MIRLVVDGSYGYSEASIILYNEMKETFIAAYLKHLIYLFKSTCQVRNLMTANKYLGFFFSYSEDPANPVIKHVIIRPPGMR